MMSDGALRVLGALLEARTGQQIAPNRHWRMDAMLKPLLRERGLESFDQLVARLTGPHDTGLADAVVDALLNNETSFFRDPVSFQLLNQALVERLREAPPAGRRLRLWCAGCSTGQEAYSLAMLGDELAAAFPGTSFDILATDVSASAIAYAARGVFSQFEVQRGLPVRSLLRWFTQERDSWRVSSRLRRMIRFERQALGVPSPGASFDMILCRNVLLYFAPERRRAFFDLFCDALAPGGQLMLGAGETILGQTSRFTPDDEFRGLYRAVEQRPSLLSA